MLLRHLEVLHAGLVAALACALRDQAVLSWVQGVTDRACVVLQLLGLSRHGLSLAAFSRHLLLGYG